MYVCLGFRERPEQLTRNVQHVSGKLRAKGFQERVELILHPFLYATPGSGKLPDISSAAKSFHLVHSPKRIRVVCPSRWGLTRPSMQINPTAPHV